MGSKPHILSFKRHADQRADPRPGAIGTIQWQVPTSDIDLGRLQSGFKCGVRAEDSERNWPAMEEVVQANCESLAYLKPQIWRNL